MARVYGVVAATGTNIVAETKKDETKAAMARAEDEQGKCTDEIAYSRTRTVSVSGFKDGVIPAAGGSITIPMALGQPSFTGLIETASTDEENKGVCKASLTAVKTDSATQVALT